MLVKTNKEKDMENKEIVYVFQGVGLTDDEKKWGKQRFRDYRSSYPHLNKLGNLHLLEELVWKEVMQERFKIQIGKLGEDKNKKNTDGTNTLEPIPHHLQESLDSGLQSIIELKTKLGMFEDQKTTDAFKDFLALKEKAAEYRKTHPLSFKCTCPYCAKVFYLKRRTEHFKEFKSPFAEDKVLNNRPLFAIYKEGRLTKEDMAAVLGVSPDYVAWLDEKIFGNVKKNVTPEIEDAPLSESDPAIQEPPASPEVNN